MAYCIMNYLIFSTFSKKMINLLTYLNKILSLMCGAECFFRHFEDFI